LPCLEALDANGAWVKYFITVSIILWLSNYQIVQAKDVSAFQIPRSNVVDLLDPVSKRTYPLFIKLPKNYQKNKDKKYPVIYLTDAWYSFQLVSGATRFPMNTGKMAEAIIVGISYSQNSKGAESRIRDYTHSLAPTWKLETGKAKEHALFIEMTVFEYIDANYRTDITNRTFVGNSLGGLFGSYLFLTKPDMFKNYVLGSPSVWFKNNDILNIQAVLPTGEHNIYIGVGSKETPRGENTSHDMVLGAKNLALKLRSSNTDKIQVKLQVITDANHETAFPTTAIQGLYWLLKRGD
jgi:predicted alpha/beta superfamily hydrolase